MESLFRKFTRHLHKVLLSILKEDLPDLRRKLNEEREYRKRNCSGLVKE